MFIKWFRFSLSIISVDDVLSLLIKWYFCFIKYYFVDKVVLIIYQVLFMLYQLVYL